VRFCRSWIASYLGAFTPEKKKELDEPAPVRYSLFMNNVTKLMCEMSTAEKIEAHMENLKAQREELAKSDPIWAPCWEKWIKESEKTLADLKG
jgi:hypothetical protein